MSTLQPLPQPSLTLAQMTELEEERSQTCELCNKTFKKMSHFNRHTRQRHGENRDYVCRQQGCQKSFKRGSHLKRHMISHTNIKNYKCEHCIMSFGYKHHLDRHIKVIHLRQRLQCVLCNLKFIKKKAYNKHNEKFHGLNNEGKTKKKQKGELKFIDHNTSTKIGKQESIKHDDIYESSSQEANGAQAHSEKELYRCQFMSCLSAFYGLYQFKRHLKRVHSHE